MPFCPSCGSEYRVGFTHCRDCDVDLVESLPKEHVPELDQTTLELVELASFPDYPEGEMIRELLDENGITTVLHGDAAAGVAPLSSPVTLLVSRADLARALELYEEYFAGDPAEELPEQEGDGQERKEDVD